MANKNLEKEYDINVVASFIENKSLVIIDRKYTISKRKKIMQKFQKDLFDFCSFIIGETIDFSNINIYAFEIRKKLSEQYPNMNYKILYFDESHLLTDSEIILALNKYRELYGDKIIIKSQNKEMIKTLTKQDK